MRHGQCHNPACPECRYAAIGERQITRRPAPVIQGTRPGRIILDDELEGPLSDVVQRMVLEWLDKIPPGATGISVIKGPARGFANAGPADPGPGQGPLANG